MVLNQKLKMYHVREEKTEHKPELKSTKIYLTTKCYIQAHKTQRGLDKNGAKGKKRTKAKLILAHPK